MKQTISSLFLMGCCIFSSFALASSQSDVNGSYTHKHKADVYDPDKEEWSSFETSDILVLKKTSDRNLHFCFELYFTNGHQCVMEDNAKWVGENRYEYLEHDAESRATECRLVIHVGTDRIKLQDMGANCREKYCGARGVIDGVEFNRSSKGKEDLECGIKY